MPRSKLEMVLQIVDWDHRYSLAKLQSGEYCIRAIRNLMKLKKNTIEIMWIKQFLLEEKEDS